jgi:integrase
MSILACMLLGAALLGLGRAGLSPPSGAACGVEPSGDAQGAAPAAAGQPGAAALPGPVEARPPALFELVFGEQAGSAWAASGQQARGWAQAFEAWLAEIGEKQGEIKTREYRSSWGRFLRFLHVPLWQAGAAEVRRWGDALAAQGMQPGTVNGYLCALSSFYRFCARTAPELFPGGKPGNPAREGRRRSQERYASAYCLNPQEAQALLDAVDRGSSLLGKRDYALLLACLETGWSIGKVRQLRWEQGDYAQAGVKVKEAIQDYLTAAGRREGMGPGEYVFAPLVHAHTPQPGGVREDWDGSRPLSTYRTNFLLKRYAAWAGLEVDKVSYYSLRHTASIRQWREGKRRCPVERVKQAAQLAQKRGKPVDRGPYQRKPGMAQPGNQLSLKHGMYAKEPPGAATQGCAPGGPPGRRGRAVKRLRWVIGRAFELGGQAQTAKQLAILLEVMGTAVERLWRLGKGRQKQAGKANDGSRKTRAFIDGLQEIRTRLDAEGRDEEGLPDQAAIDAWRKEIDLEMGQDEQEMDMTAELGMLDEMIARAEQAGRENVRLDEGLALLSAVSQAEVRRERCTGGQEKGRQTPDERLEAALSLAIDDVLEELKGKAGA